MYFLGSLTQATVNTLLIFPYNYTVNLFLFIKFTIQVKNNDGHIFIVIQLFEVDRCDLAKSATTSEKNL